MYYSTTDITRKQLSLFSAGASTQDERILKYFEQDPQRLASPTELLDIVFSNTVPVTSVRRARSSLTAASKLIKTDQQVEGAYGRPEHLWRLVGG